MRCTGHCCKNFYLPYSQDELKKDYQEWAKGERPKIKEIYLIYPMVIPTENPNQYTCKHLSTNGDCQIYEDRPIMCKEFPYDGEPCRFKECTMKEKSE